MNNVLVPVLVVSVLCIFVFIFNLHLHNYRSSTKISQTTRFLTNKLSKIFYSNNPFYSIVQTVNLNYL